MSEYYRGKRTRNIYDPKEKKPFKISRSAIDLFVTCPRCFYLDRKLGVGRPPGYPFSLNIAVDALLKKEFDIHRAKGQCHPLMKKYGIEARPVDREEMDDWRTTLKGIRYLHKQTNLLIYGAIDDLWENDKRQFIVVDYKATAKQEAIVALDKEWQDGYKRQMEVYQWLFRRNGFEVARRGYFVYCNGKTDREAFDARLEFDITLVPHDGDDKWVEGVIGDLHACLNRDVVPKAAEGCDYCRYRHDAAEVMGNLPERD